MIFDDVTVCSVCGKQAPCKCRETTQEDTQNKCKSNLNNRRYTILSYLFYKGFKYFI